MDDRHVGTIDADGVAPAAIQGLHQLVQDKDARIAALEERLTALERESGLNSASAGLLTSGVPIAWLLLGGLLLAALVLGWRRRGADEPQK